MIGERVKITCKNCKKEWLVLPSRSGRKFCSIQCVGKYTIGKKHSWIPSTAFKVGHKYFEKEDSSHKKSIAKIGKKWTKEYRLKRGLPLAIKYKRYIHTTWTKRYKKWRLSVFKRDEYMCQECDQKGGYLQAHHLLDWANHKNERYLVKNGVCLCKKCHKYVHWVERLIAKQIKEYDKKRMA